jgi:Pyruvate/2-oxoacid:ferredoxin oxidoreductase delta subunit
MKTFYFTGTGNSLQVARSIGSEGELVSIPKFLREHQKTTERILIDEDAIGLVFPTYWLSLPAIVVEFLERVRMKTDYLFVVNTRGNTSLTLKSHLLQTASQNGHQVAYFGKISMPDNWLPLCDMAKEKQRFKDEELAQRIETLARSIRARKRNVSGFAGLGFLQPTITRRAALKADGFTKRFTINGTCKGCGTCAEVCSAQSIKMIDGHPIYGETCNACLACVHHCPERVIHMHGEKTAERYINPTVSVADIILAH